MEIGGRIFYQNDTLQVLRKYTIMDCNYSGTDADIQKDRQSEDGRRQYDRKLQNQIDLEVRR